jgi:hypothetical protein
MSAAPEYTMAFPLIKEYQTSDLWRSFRAAKIASVGGHCEKCPETGHLQIHHLRHASYGCENFEDVEVLCRRCHVSQMLREPIEVDPARVVPYAQLEFVPLPRLLRDGLASTGAWVRRKTWFHTAGRVLRQATRGKLRLQVYGLRTGYSIGAQEFAMAGLWAVTPDPRGRNCIRWDERSPCSSVGEAHPGQWIADFHGRQRAEDDAESAS